MRRAASPSPSPPAAGWRHAPLNDYPRAETFFGWPARLALNLLLVLFLGAIDYATGVELGFSIFYVIPIALTAWQADRASALAVSAASAGAWLVAEILGGHQYTHRLILYWNAGVRFGFFWIVVTILCRLRAAFEERARLVRELEQSLAERRRAQEELQRQAEELARSNAELEQYAAVAAHDLKSPLVAVAGFVQLLHRRLQGRGEQEAEELCRRTLEGVQRMDTLIAALLAYSQVGQGSRPAEPTDADAALKQALENLAPELKSRSAVVTSDPLPPVLAGEVELVRLFQNLIANAVKFSAEPPRIHIWAEPSGSRWLLSVQDNGIGVDPGSAKKIFGLFQRLRGAEYPGTGIGLATCRKIVERWGGKIWVESEPGKGSTFRFALPAAPPERAG